jgi:hypothetical protein
MTDTSTSEIRLSTAEEVAEKLDAAGLRLDIPPDTARLIVRTLRRLSGGRPVPIEEVTKLAADLAGSDEASAFIGQMSEKDNEGNVVGLLGLSLNDHPHELEVNGIELRAWCAWDTLFLPSILGQAAHVVSKDPATGEEVRLRVTPQGVERTRPQEIVVSVVVPEVEEGQIWTAERAQMLFCNFVHFFADGEAAARWFAERKMPVSFLTVDEAFKLGRARLADIIAQA